MVVAGENDSVVLQENRIYKLVHQSLLRFPRGQVHLSVLVEEELDELTRNLWPLDFLLRDFDLQLLHLRFQGFQPPFRGGSENR